MKKLMIFFAISIFTFGCNQGKNADNIETGEAGMAAESEGVTYVLNPEESVLQWRGTKPTGEHTGTVEFKEGEITVKEGDITSGNFIIDLNSIVNEDLENEEMNAKLVGHLKSEDFFHVEEYPEAKFQVVEIKKINEGTESGKSPEMEITGNLNMRGITKSITIPAKIEYKDDYIIAQTDEFSIDRTEWNVNFQSKKVFAGLKDQYIDDAINLKMKLRFEKAQS